MPRLLTRSSFLAGAAVAAIAPSAAFAAQPPDLDLANARLLVTVELLLVDFWSRAKLPIAKRAHFNEVEHLAAVSQILTGAGQTPATAADIDFTYPAKKKPAAIAVDLERMALGAYLGAVDTTTSTDFRHVFSLVAASEAEHLSALHGFRNSFPEVLTIDQASDALSGYTS